MNLLEILWSVDPEIFSFGGITIRWYGVLFALGFMTGQYIITKIWNWENQPEEDLDYLLLAMVVSVVVGARLGHCLFYEPAYYLSHPIEILKVWKGGLASHGTTFGILGGIWLYANYTMNFSPFYIRKQARPRQSWFYILDRMVIVIALGGTFIRFGNLMNSEIVGSPTTLPWGFRFLKNMEPGIAEIARHPSQLYESISCLFLFVFLFWLYNKTREKTPEGRLLGLFMIILFTLRFFYEFVKEDQVDFEAGMLFNMGQLLSIPFIFMGMAIFWYSTKQPKKI